MNILCAVLVAVFDHSGQVVINTFDLYGPVTSQDDLIYIADFSESVKRLPIVGSPKNYSAVEVDKRKCIVEDSKNEKPIAPML